MVKQQLIKREKSKDNLRNFSWTKDTATIYPEFSFDAVLAAVAEEPLVTGVMTDFVDSCMEGDYAILKRDSQMYDREFERKLDEEYKFRNEVLRKIFYVGKFFQNVFVEVIRNTDGSVKALNVLDSTNVEPITEPNGDIIEYRSRIHNPITGTRPRWDKDEIVWFKFNDRSSGYGTVDLKSLWETLCLKKNIRRYVTWLWKTGQYRVMYAFETTSDDDVHDFIAFNKKHDEDFTKPFLGKGKITPSVLRDMKEQSNIVEMLKYCDSQILIALREPPIDAGIPDASGRSNADAQGNSKARHVTSYKKVVEDVINFQLFPIMNKGNSLIRFSPNDRFEEAKILENVAAMKGMGMTEDLIREYLQDRGMFFGAEELFEDPVEMAAATAEATNVAPATPGQKKPMAMMPSRRKKQEMQKQGSGAQSSTRPEQVSKR